MDASSSSTPPDAGWTAADRQFLLELVQQARALGLAEIRYKDLTVRLLPAASDTHYATTKFSNSSWAPRLGRAGDESK